MKMLSLLFALFITIPNINVDLKQSMPVQKQCVAADKIIRPIIGWKIISTEFVKKKEGLMLQVYVHNPLNKQNNNIDAEFIFSVNNSSGIGTSNYDLQSAIYHNLNNNVKFDRIYDTQKIKTNNGFSKMKIETPCFNRIIETILHITPIIIKNPTT